MKIYSVLQIGEYHVNHCEDYLFIGEIGEEKILCAVMDGCTMATDSYFVATLVGKLLRKVAKEKAYMEFYSPSLKTDIDTYLKSIVRELFQELNKAKAQFMLDDKELLTTLIILLFDKKEDNGMVLIVGDGVVCINGTITEFDQDNKPDYLGFHLNEGFEAWYDVQRQKIFFNSLQDISIATNGIGMFKPVNKVDTTETIDPVEYLLLDKTGEENEYMLSSKMKKLEYSFGLKPTDDLAIVRIIA